MANRQRVGLGLRCALSLASLAAGVVVVACTSHGPLTPGPSGPGLVEMLARETADAAVPDAQPLGDAAVPAAPAR